MTPESNLKNSAEPLELLVGADDAYAMPLAVTLYSALEHLNPGRCVNVTIIDGGIASANRERIKRVLERPQVQLQLRWITADQNALADLPTGTGEFAYLSKAMYLRLFAPSLISAARVIYLDSDTLVQHDLDTLWALDLKPYAVAAVADLGTTLAGGNERYKTVWQQQGLDLELPHFNSGILLLNLDKWRDTKISEAAFANIREFCGAYAYPDQDGLNAVLQNDWLELDNRWNFQVTYGELKHRPLPIKDIGVLHFLTPHKPWKKLVWGEKKRYYDRYLQALGRCRWFSPTEQLLFHAQLLARCLATAPMTVSRRAAHKLVKRSLASEMKPQPKRLKEVPKAVQTRSK